MSKRKTLAALTAATAASLSTVAMPEPAAAHGGRLTFGNESCRWNSNHTNVVVWSGLLEFRARCQWQRSNGAIGYAWATTGETSSTIAPGALRFRLCQYEQSTLVGCTSWVKA